MLDVLLIKPYYVFKTMLKSMENERKYPETAVSLVYLASIVLRSTSEVLVLCFEVNYYDDSVICSIMI